MSAPTLQSTVGKPVEQNKLQQVSVQNSVTKDLKTEEMSFEKVIQVLQKMEEKIDNTLNTLKLNEVTRKVDVHKQKITLLTEKIDLAVSDHDKVQIMTDIIV